MSPCSRHPREYGLKLLFLKTEVEKSGDVNYVCPTDRNNPYAMLMLLKEKGILE